MDYDFEFGPIWAHADQLATAAGLTLALSTMAMVLGLAVGIVCVYLRAAWPRIFVPVVTAYVNVIRNTPFLVQIFLVFFGLPQIGLRLSANEAAVWAMVLNAGAYASEILRAGVEAVGKGQREGAQALGLSPLQTYGLVVLPPALQAVYPSLSSQFILLMLTSSALSVISVDELTAVANDISSETFRTIEVYIVIAVIYLIMSLGLSAILDAIYRRCFRHARFLTVRR
jgi:polar amino acid transport system permease protein